MITISCSSSELVEICESSETFSLF